MPNHRKEYNERKILKIVTRLKEALVNDLTSGDRSTTLDQVAGFKLSTYFYALKMDEPSRIFIIFLSCSKNLTITSATLATSTRRQSDLPYFFFIICARKVIFLILIIFLINDGKSPVTDALLIQSYSKDEEMHWIRIFNKNTNFIKKPI